MGSAASHASYRASQAELARILGVTRQSINELVARGILEVGRDDKLDVELARQAIAARVHPGAKTAQAINTPPAGVTAAAPPASTPAAPADADAANATSFHVAKTLREAAEASIAQHKLKQLTGELVLAEDVRRAGFAAGRKLRDMLVGIPDRLATQLAAESDPAKIHAALDEEIRRVCDELAGLGNE